MFLVVHDAEAKTRYEGAVEKWRCAWCGARPHPQAILLARRSGLA